MHVDDLALDAEVADHLLQLACRLFQNILGHLCFIRLRRFGQVVEPGQLIAERVHGRWPITRHVI